MRHKDDIGGGSELKRVKDGQIFVLMNTTNKERITYEKLGSNASVYLSGEYETLDIKNTEKFGGGSGQAKFIITKLTEVKSKNTGKAQNYTNQFYPSLNIKYDDSWQMLTNNFPPDSGFEKKSFDGSPILNRVIVLAKNGTTVSFTIYLSGGFGGGGDNIIQGNKISENIYRYTSVKNKGGQLYDYISKPTSTNSNTDPTYNLNSTLKLENGTPAVAGVIVSSFIANSNLLKEADAIVAGSSFGVPIK